jgi:hypothetical protein
MNGNYGILGNPLLHMGLGILSQSGATRLPQGGAGIGRGGLLGMESFRQQQQSQAVQQAMRQQAELKQAQMDALRQAQEQELASRGAYLALLGNRAAPAMGTGSEFDHPGKFGAQAVPGAGMLGGEIGLNEAALKMMAIPGYEKIGAGLLGQQTAAAGKAVRPLTDAEKEAAGIPKNQFAQVDAHGKISMPGTPMVNINQGLESAMDKPLKSAELLNYRDKDGNPPDRIMTPRELINDQRGFSLDIKATEKDKVSSYVADSLDTASNAVETILSNPKFDPSSVRENFGSISNWLASSEYQQYRAASDEWATNLVFLRSGSTARQEEKDSAFENYWPQGGDTSETRAFKTRFRMRQEINAYELAAKGNRITRKQAEKKIRQIENRLKKIEKDEKAALQVTPPPGFIED